MRAMQLRTCLLSLVVGFWVLCGCSSSSPTDPEESTPQWLSNVIAQIASEPVSDPPSSIWRYRYHGAVVYYRPTRCCDFFSDLYDRSGALLCHPDGGIAAGGDGKCPDFFAVRTDEALIWRDTR